MSTQAIPIRLIDFQITDSNGPKDIGGMIETAKRSINDRIRTVLCVDGSGNEAVVLVDESGVTRTYDFRTGDGMNRDEAAALIGVGIDWRLVVEDGEAVPMVASATYREHDQELEFLSWHPSPEGTEGYDPMRYFEGHIYLGPDCHGVSPEFTRKLKSGAAF